MSKSERSFRKTFVNILISVFIQRDENGKSREKKFMRLVTCIDIVLVAIFMLCIAMILFVPLNNDTALFFIFVRDIINAFLAPSLLVNIFLLFAA